MCYELCRVIGFLNIMKFNPLCLSIGTGLHTLFNRKFDNYF